MKTSTSRFTIIPFILLLCLALSCGQRGEKADVEEGTGNDLELEKIPAVVMNTLMTKFPKAEIHKWTMEQEGDIMVYDIEFKHEDQKFEADIKEDGTIHNWEKEIAFDDLPDTVQKVVEVKYPESPIEEVMEITAVIDGEDALEGYEIVFESTDQKEVEIMVAPDGTILEESDETD